MPEWDQDFCDEGVNKLVTFCAAEQRQLDKPT